MSETDKHTSRRDPLTLAAVAYAAFVVYGSLVPLEYRALPWEDAVARFAAMPFLHLGIGSRADWVANLLLFIPLAFLWMGVLARRGGAARTGLAALALIPLLTVLSLSIEFTQLFFPQRTVSQNDVFAETLGGVLGVLLWTATGGRFLRWLQDWQRVHARAALAERLSWVYLAGVFVYNVLPLDLTLSVVEIFHKWREGRVNLIPFGDVPSDAALALYELATDVLIWVPLAVLWRLDGKRRALRAWTMVFGTATVLEGLQLFVYSRVTDVTDLFTAAVGAAIGVLAGGILRTRLAPQVRTDSTPDRRQSHGGPGGPIVLAAAWAIALLLGFWFPFDFRTDAGFIASRLDFLQRVPFEVYYFGTEYRAATEVLRKTLFFAPFGALLAWSVARQSWRWRAPFAAAAMLAIAGLPALVEGGQVLLPHKIPDTTDWLVAWLGGLAGYGVARRFLRAPRHAPPASLQESRVGTPHASRRWHPAAAIALMTLAFWGSARASFLPYNVRELLPQDHTALSALLLALACYWSAVWPVWIARRRVSGRTRIVQLPLGLLAYGLVGFLLLYAAVPSESLYDVLGTPVLGWPAWAELGTRWIALAAFPGALLYLAVQTVRSMRGLALRALHFWAVVPVLLLAYWGIVVEASTDNLVELIAAPRALGFVALGLWGYVLFFSTILLASPGAPGRRAPRVVAALAMLPLAAGLLSLGLADDVEKYGQHFSALQFLLSTDRAHYADPATLWLRYAVVHVLVIAALAFIQWPHLRGAPPPNRQASHAFH